MKLPFAISLFGLLTLVGCQPYVVPPSLDGVTPNWGFNGDNTDVEIRGTNLFPGVDAQGGTVEGFEREFHAELLGVQTAALSSVRLYEEGKLRATVEDGLPPGWYDLRVRTPAGLESTLEGAFEVTDSRIDHVRITTDTPTNQVQKYTILRVSLRDPGGRLVEEGAPIKVTLGGDLNETPPITFDSGDIERPADMENGLGFTGQIGPAGESYFGFRSDEPGSFWVNVEVSIRDRVNVANTALVQFQAGSVAALDIQPVLEREERVAGEEFDIDLRLVDEGGNTVSGTVASVLLTEACVGGTFQHLETFVDDARVTVRPTKACADNRILGLAVVEAQSVQGESAPFAVVGGPLRDLAVVATPSDVLAGQEELSVRVSGRDAWGNSIDSELGELHLMLGTSPLDEGAGTGSFACSGTGDGSQLCTVVLFTAGPAITIRAVSAAGATGDSNAVEVYPGPIEQLEVRGEIGVVEAGSAYPVTISAIDRFGNRLPLSDTDLAELNFFDRYESLDCDDVGSDPSLLGYHYECRFLVAGRDNELRVVLPTLGAVGTHAPISVKAGRINTVVIHTEPHLASRGISVGERFLVNFEGRDAFGNKGEGTTRVELFDIAGSVMPETITLSEGLASVELHTTASLTGNSLWAFVDGKEAGGSTAFDVRPGGPAALQLSTTMPWIFEDNPLVVELSVLDEYGNLADGSSPRVTIYDNDSEVHTEVVTGKSSFELPMRRAGESHHISARSDRFSTRLQSVPVVRDCPDDTPMDTETIGADDGRICLSSDTEGRVRMLAPDGAVTWMVEQDGHLIDTEGETAVDLVWTDPGASNVRSLAVSDGDCGWEGHHPFFIGSDLDASGDINVTMAKDLLYAGTSAPESFSEVWVQAYTCTGDVASHRELTVQPMLGDVYDSATFITDGTVSTTNILLDGSGEGTFVWSMHEESVGGEASLLLGNSNGSAHARQTVDVQGDSTAPTVWSVSPSGLVTEAVELVSFEFSEPMLDRVLTDDSRALVTIHTPDGRAVDPEDYFWTEGQRVLNIPLLELPMSTDGVWSILISDDMRDAAGNRLDGDWDGEPGGEWTGHFGSMVVLDASFADCYASTGWFDPFAADAEYTVDELPQIHFTVTSTAPTMWWRMDILDTKAEKIRRIERLRTGLTSGNLSWDGRDENGHIVVNSTYTARLVPLDANRNEGEPCHVSFIVDSPLQR